MRYTQVDFDLEVPKMITALKELKQTAKAVFEDNTQETRFDFECACDFVNSLRYHLAQADSYLINALSIDEFKQERSIATDFFWHWQEWYYQYKYGTKDRGYGLTLSLLSSSKGGNITKLIRLLEEHIAGKTKQA